MTGRSANNLVLTSDDESTQKVGIRCPADLIQKINRRVQEEKERARKSDMPEPSLTFVMRKLLEKGDLIYEIPGEELKQLLDWYKSRKMGEASPLTKSSSKA